MAGYFSAAVAAKMAGNVVRLNHLIFCDFKSGAVRVWGGAGAIVSGGHTWQGSRGMIGVSDIDASAQSYASTFSLTLSGLPDEHLDAYMRLFAADAEEYRLRQVIVFLQCFDDAWQPLDDPYALASGFMDVPRYSRDASGPRIALQCEGPLVTRRRPRFGYYTDQDQQRRYPGDDSLKWAPIAATRNVKMPVI